MIDILLMTPLPGFLEAPPGIPDLGLGYIAAAIRKNKFSVEILDWNTRLNQNEFVQFLSEKSPKLVGIKVFTVNFKGAFKTIQIIKKVLPDTIIVIGGPHPSTSEPDDIFEELPEIDFAFRGEVESSFPPFLNVLRSINFDRRRVAEIAKEFSSISGLVLSDDNMVRSVPPLLQDITSFPLPAWDLINPNNYDSPPLLQQKPGKNNHVAPIITTRGCPFPCTFCCAYHINGKKVRRRDVNNVIDEIEMLYRKYDIQQFYIMDSAFSLDSDYVVTFCDEIIRRRLNIKWDCIYEILANHPVENIKDLFEKMSHAGCVCIILGIETASKNIMNVSKKIYESKKVTEIITYAHKMNIKTQGFFIFGFPQETVDDVKQTVDFALSQSFDALHFGYLLPLPGTKIYYDLKKRYHFQRIDWANYHAQNPPYQIGEISPSNLNRLRAMANFKAHYRLNKGMKKIIGKKPVSYLIKYLLNYVFKI